MQRFAHGVGAALWRGRLGEPGQHDREAGHPWPAGHQHGAAVRSDHRVHDREAEPGGRGVGRVRAGCVRAGEPLKQVGQQVGRDAGPVVGDGQHHPRSGRDGPVLHGLAAGRGFAWRELGADPDGDRGAFRGMPPGVAEQVAEHLVQPVLVAADQHRVVGQFEHPAVVGSGHAGVARRLDGHPRHVHRVPAQRPAGVKPGEQQQVVDQNAHPGGLRKHAGQRARHRLRRVARVPQRQLGVAADGGERRAQLVAGVGGEPAQPRLARRAAMQRRLHVPEHPVERQPDLAGLGVRVGVGHALRQVDLARLERQFGHLGRRGSHPAQRAQ